MRIFPESYIRSSAGNLSNFSTDATGIGRSEKAIRRLITLKTKIHLRWKLCHALVYDNKWRIGFIQPIHCVRCPGGRENHFPGPGPSIHCRFLESIRAKDTLGCTISKNSLIGAYLIEHPLSGINDLRGK